MKGFHKHSISFKHAYDGVLWALRSQPNYRIHIVFSTIAVFLGWTLAIDYYEWLLIILLITMGLVIETLNTGLEATTDAITREWREEIKIAKDVAAAAMLTFAVGAVIIAVMIFVPKIAALIL
ncbi:diacylglycerol kinase family protein [Candidatus Woesebacteria bacterium]|nr:diacylglycerol kinase family protein [Candidatus Woesebacteria bacterium]